MPFRPLPRAALTTVALVLTVVGVTGCSAEEPETAPPSSSSPSPASPEPSDPSPAGPEPSSPSTSRPAADLLPDAVSGAKVSDATVRAWAREWARVDRTIEKLDPDIPTSPCVALPGRQRPWFGLELVTDGGRAGHAIFGLMEGEDDTYSCDVSGTLVVVDLATRTAEGRLGLFDRIEAPAGTR